MTFGQQLGSIPDRGEVQEDVFLNGFTYLQMINDVADPENPVGIHVESGFWVHVPATQDPPQQESVFRQGSIPHGTQICAGGMDVLVRPLHPAITLECCAAGLRRIRHG